MMHNNISITDQVYVHLKYRARAYPSSIYSNPTMKPDGELSQFTSTRQEDIQEALRLIAAG
jgi:hypothetical protein